MKTHKWEDLKRQKIAPERLAEIEEQADAEVLEMDLRALRELLSMTQSEVAEAAEMTQSELSKTERRRDHRLSTIRRYVQALGGDIEVVAIFGDKRLRLRGV